MVCIVHDIVCAIIALYPMLSGYTYQGYSSVPLLAKELTPWTIYRYSKAFDTTESADSTSVYIYLFLVQSLFLQFGDI